MSLQLPAFQKPFVLTPTGKGISFFPPDMDIAANFNGNVQFQVTAHCIDQTDIMCNASTDHILAKTTINPKHQCKIQLIKLMK